MSGTIAQLVTITLAVASLASSEVALSAGKPTQWLAFGGLRGHIEPCGCDPVTDLGGITRIATSLMELRNSRQPPPFVFDLGNNLPESPGADISAKLTAVLAFNASIQADATLFNELEARHLPDLRKFLQAGPKASRYVLSTLEKDINNIKWLKYSQLEPGLIVLGFSPVIKSPLPELLQQWRTYLTKHGYKRFKVLLANGDDTTIASIKKAQLFDLILTSNQQPYGSDPDQKEKANPGRLLRQSGVYQIPSFGQGILTSSILNADAPLAGLLTTPNHAKECQPSLSIASCQNLIDLNPQKSAPEPIIWLTRTYNRPSPVDHILTSYHQAGAQAFQKRALSRRGQLAQSPFGGSDSCRSCHPQAYQTWQASAHAHAIATLAAKGQGQQPECVTCHVLGYEVTGGYADQESSPQFANVQCENCHGAAGKHAANPSTHKPANDNPRAACTGCHKTPHSSAFSWEDYWPKIQH